MKLSKCISIILVPLSMLAAHGVFAQDNELGWTMERAVKQLDRQGEDFETVLADADIEWKKKDGTVDRTVKGRIYMNEDGDVRLSAAQPTEHTMLVSGSTLYQHDPAKAVVEEYRLSQHKDRLEPYVALGFSTTGKDLSDDFLVTFVGEQQIGGRRALGLELTPIKDSTRQAVARIELWVDQASWLPVRQIITQSAGGDSMTVTYTGTARNLALNPDLFKDDWPKGTEKIRK